MKPKTQTRIGWYLHELRDKNARHRFEIMPPKTIWRKYLQSIYS